MFSWWFWIGNRYLDGAPGIYSSRWAGKNNNFNKAISRVFKKINKKDKNWKQKKIKARFICVLTIYWPNEQSVCSIGKVDGHILADKKGNNGFGYDPIFIPLKKRLTFGQMKPKNKYKIEKTLENKIKNKKKHNTHHNITKYIY